jgi:glycosyltransferase involved in cell wall biosynthesis
MKVCQFIDTYYPVVDGAINVAKHYAHYVSKKEECVLAVPKAKQKDYVDNEIFKVVRCKSGSAPENYRCGYPMFDGKFKKQLEQENFDVLHTHSPYFLGRHAIKLGKKKGIPVVATLHTQYHQDFERIVKNKTFVKFLIKYIMKVFNNADSVWTVSQRSCDILRSYGYKGNIEVVRNGTDFTYPENASELIKRVNDIHNLEGQENVFLFVGRMCWYKNLKIILDALDIVKKTDDNFKMIFVGGGFDFDEVKAYAEEKGLKDNCIFTNAVKDKELLQGYYLRGDLLLFPSTFDMAPVTAVEAAAHNLAAIMVEGSCSAELVSDNENGFLANENAESFAERIVELMKKPELVKKVGLNAGKTLYRSWDMVGEEVIEKYKKVISEYKAKKQTEK